MRRGQGSQLVQRRVTACQVVLRLAVVQRVLQARGKPPAHRTVDVLLQRPLFLRRKCRDYEIAENVFLRLHPSREDPLPLFFDGVRLDKSYLADVIVEAAVLLELKTIEHILPLHEAQTRTYLKLSRCRLALLKKFNSEMLKDGISRFALTRPTPRHAAPPPAPGGPRTTPTPPEAPEPAATTAA